MTSVADVQPPTLGRSRASSVVGAGGEPILEIQGLRKSYGSVPVLHGLDLQVRRGEVFGFLGRNGAGKSTTIRILMGISRADQGEIRLFGETADHRSLALRQRIGYVAQEQNFYGWMTPLGLGRFVRGFYPRWQDEVYRDLLTRLDLPIHRKVRTFSGGMKVKLALAIALAPNPELLILDEPTAGLDPVARREFLEMVRQQAQSSGRTTFFSTHLIDEVEFAANRLGVVDSGKTRFQGTVAELSERIHCLSRPQNAELDAIPLQLPASGLRILHERRLDGWRQLVVESDDPSVVALFAHQGQWRVGELPLEELFIEMVRRPVKGTF